MGKPIFVADSQPVLAAGLAWRRLLRWFIPGALLLLVIGPAAADSIDGNWCYSDGRRFSIRGPEIVTPGGNKLAGNYGRHDFSYTAPTTEPAAGQTIFMLLVNENTVRVKIGSAPAYSEPAEVWNRCGPSIS